MTKDIALNAQNLPILPEDVKIPAYDRSQIKCGIIHVGIGGFHRAHQAFYTDQLFLEHGLSDWGICGIALLDSDKKIYETLVQQDGLYTLMITEMDGTTSARVIGSIVDYLFAPANPAAVIEKMAHPDIKIITLTITEGGYNFNTATGEFQLEEPAIQWDLNNPDRPKTIFGYLTQAFKLRMERGLKGLTLQSCDNIQHNGAVAKRMLLSYIAAAAPEILIWVNENVSFPNSMVDRITPVTSAADINLLKEKFSIDDQWPVVCEPFTQWVIEDHFINGRPDWDKVGAQFVRDVSPYEKMKIRLVNGGHVALGFTGYLNGYQYVYETIADEVFARFVREFIEKEAIPILDEVPGIDVDAYKEMLLLRFANPYIKDQLTRIFSESSAKIPKFLIPTIIDQLETNGNIDRSVLMLAAWARHLEISSVDASPVQDEMQEVLLAKAKASLEGDETAFLRMEQVFGDLASNERFVNLYVSMLKGVREHGIWKMIKTLEL